MYEKEQAKQKTEVVCASERVRPNDGRADRQRQVDRQVKGATGRSMFRGAFRCKKTDEAAARVVDDCVAKGYVATPPGTDRPAIRVLREMVEGGWANEREDVEVWKMLYSEIEDEGAFLAQVGPSACARFFFLRARVCVCSYVCVCVCPCVCLCVCVCFVCACT